jgi:uncharacterized protein (UPF0333 family)
MATKGLAVSQIILLVLGIIVLAVVAYLLYTQFVSTGGTISAEQCRAEATRICTGCAIAGSANCVYTDKTLDGKDTSIETCVAQGKVVGNAQANTLDCSVLTGQSSAASAIACPAKSDGTSGVGADGVCTTCAPGKAITTDADKGKCSA